MQQRILQQRILQFAAAHNRRRGATVLLASHCVADVTALCRRVAVINHGRQLRDFGLGGYTHGASMPTATARSSARQVARSRCACRAPKRPSPWRACFPGLPVVDLALEHPPIEHVNHWVFQTAPEAAAEAA
ncbi:MAG TPA: hypothetical protein VLH79_12755 [Chthonomonadales bacterium]|nr:hypothetical protein [Chthonomonadales bacterium]